MGSDSAARNERYPTKKPCAAELQSLVPGEGPGVIRDESYGKPPGSYDVSNILDLGVRKDKFLHSSAGDICDDETANVWKVAKGKAQGTLKVKNVGSEDAPVMATNLVFNSAAKRKSTSQESWD